MDALVCFGWERRAAHSPGRPLPRSPSSSCASLRADQRYPSAGGLAPSLPAVRHEAGVKEALTQCHIGLPYIQLAGVPDPSHVRATDRLERWVGLEDSEQPNGTVLQPVREDTTTYQTDRALLVKLANGQLEAVAHP